MVHRTTTARYWLAAATLLACLGTMAEGQEDVRGEKLLQLHTVYVTNQDREPLPAYRERLHRIMIDVQDFYGTEMARNGHGSMTFPLEMDDAGRVVVHVVTLPWDFDPARRFTPAEIRPHIMRSLAAAGIDGDRSYFVAFMNAYWKDRDTWTYDVVYTGSGGPAHGATWVTDHALLDAANLDPTLTARINDRGQDLSVGEFNVKMIGGVAHELGHGLGLPHNRERPEQYLMHGRALMGAGNYTYRRERLGPTTGAFLTAPHSMILSVHPLFTGKRAADLSVPDVSLGDMAFDHAGGRLVISGTIQAAEPVAGLVLYHDKLPTGVNQDYDAWPYLGEVLPSGQFAAGVDLPEAGEFALHLTFVFRNGTQRTFSFTDTITGELKPDLEALRNTSLWHRIRTAFLNRDLASLRQVAPDVEANLPGRADALRRFLDVCTAWDASTSPAQTPADKRLLVLSDCRWQRAAVGWTIPSANGIMHPDGESIEPLQSTQGTCAKGLYAHAPSCYAYALGAGWERLRSRFGLQSGHAGSVVFVVRGDGRELFRSAEKTTASPEGRADIDVKGVELLELIVEPGNDGNSSDWGIWFEPTLSR